MMSAAALVMELIRLTAVDAPKFALLRLMSPAHVFRLARLSRLAPLGPDDTRDGFRAGRARRLRERPATAL